MYLPKYFAAHELVPPHIFQQRGAKSFELIDDMIADYERGFFRMSPSASRLVPPVIANQGQFGEAVRFIIPGPSGTVIFTRDSVIVVLKQKTADARFLHDFEDLALATPGGGRR